MSLSVLTAIYPDGPAGLAGTRISPFSILFEQRMAEVVATTGLFTGRMPFLSPSQSTEGGILL